MKATWEQIRQSSQRVTWHKVIWFLYNIPRYAFISWLAIRDRLAAGARTRSWGSTQQSTLCGEPNETRDHLFFACPYSFSVCTSLCGNLIGRTITADWTYTLQSITQNRRSKQDNFLIKNVLPIMHLPPVEGKKWEKPQFFISHFTSADPYNRQIHSRPPPLLLYRSSSGE